MTIKRVYLSSTFKDLLPFRAAVARALRRINKEVEGMEDYVTSDERPLDKCRNGVTAADVYVGLFAHRYGFIPTGDNPGQKSITELEYAGANQKSPAFCSCSTKNRPGRRSSWTSGPATATAASGWRVCARNSRKRIAATSEAKRNSRHW